MRSASPPTGDVTFLFTDIVGSTERWEQHGDAFLPVLQAHNAILNDAIKRYGGHIFKTEGDCFKVAFKDPAAAVRCAILAQAMLQRYPWPADGGPLRVRMAVHTGRPFVQANDYFGPPVNRSARILAAAHGGQILLSEDTLQKVGPDVDPGARFLDQGPQQLKDLDTPVRLFQADHPALQQTHFPPPDSLNGHAHNLPPQRRSFVGREREIEEIAHQLARGDRRLLTLTGPAGAGKTRLAVQASVEYIRLFPDGVWSVSLTNATDLETAAREIAEALRVPVPPGEPALPCVREHLVSRSCLLILDDIGGVPQADRLIRELLSDSPALRCLATSRQPLNADEGSELTVPELSRPPDDPTPEQLAASEAGRLFIERAHEARDDFRVSPQGAKTIGRLFSAIQTFPGTVESVAASMKSATPEKVTREVTGFLSGAAKRVAKIGKQAVAPADASAEMAAVKHSIVAAMTDSSAPDEEARKWREVLMGYYRLGDRARVAEALHRLGGLAERRRDYARAITLLRAAHQLYLDLHSPESLAVRADLEQARQRLGHAEAGAIPTVEEAVSAAMEPG